MKYRIGKIVKAAIKRGDKIITGMRHFDCITQAIAEGWKKPVRVDEQGFIDEAGIYWNRHQARAIAKRTGQIPHSHTKVLLSEDLW